METIILKFAASARATGMRISTAEVLTCLEMIPHVDILDEAQFKTVLRSNFAKSRLEQARFDHLYPLFFHELREDLDAGSMEIAAHLETLRREISEVDPPMQAMTALAEFVSGEPQAYLTMLQEIRSEGQAQGDGPGGKGSNLGGLVRRLPILRSIQRARETSMAFLDDNWRDIHWETRKELKQHLERRLATAQRMLTENNPPGLIPLEKKGPAPGLHGELGDIPFANLSPGEIVRLRDVIAKLTRKLRDMSTRRYAARSRGVPDIKRTLRAATRTQGIPLQLKYREKPPRKGRIVVFCDVSGSVWSSAKFMLTVLYALQDCFDRVKSFVFVDEPINVTHFFDDFEINQALTEILDCPDINYAASTDYGRMLRLFKRQYMDTINKKTTVIMIGDGRSNYCNPEEDILEMIRDRSRRLLWINPENEKFWHSGDSEMAAYEPLCNEVRHVENLNQLAAFIREIVL